MRIDRACDRALESLAARWPRADQMWGDGLPGVDRLVNVLQSELQDAVDTFQNEKIPVNALAEDIARFMAAHPTPEATAHARVVDYFQRLKIAAAQVAHCCGETDGAVRTAADENDEPDVSKAEEWLADRAFRTDAWSDGEAIVYLVSRGNPPPDFAPNVKRLREHWLSVKKQYLQEIEQKRDDKTSPLLTDERVTVSPRFWRLGRTSGERLSLDATMMRVAESAGISGFEAVWLQLGDQIVLESRSAGPGNLRPAYSLFTLARSDDALRLLRQQLCSSIRAIIENSKNSANPWEIPWSHPDRAGPKELVSHVSVAAALAFAIRRLNVDEHLSLARRAEQFLLAAPTETGAWADFGKDRPLIYRDLDDDVGRFRPLPEDVTVSLPALNLDVGDPAFPPAADYPVAAADYSAATDDDADHLKQDSYDELAGRYPLPLSVLHTCMAIHALWAGRPAGWKAAVDAAKKWLSDQQSPFGCWDQELDREEIDIDQTFLTVLVLDTFELARGGTRVTFDCRVLLESAGTRTAASPDRGAAATAEAPASSSGEQDSQDSYVPGLGRRTAGTRKADSLGGGTAAGPVTSTPGNGDRDSADGHTSGPGNQAGNAKKEKDGRGRPNLPAGKKKTYRRWDQEWQSGKYKTYAECADTAFGKNVTKDDIRNAVDWCSKNPRRPKSGSR